MILLMALILAAAPGDDPALDRCIDGAESQQEITTCAEQGWERADRALNRAYAAAMARVRADDSFTFTEDGRPSGEVLLRDVQRAWIAQRDQFCQLIGYEARGGTNEPFLEYNCRAEMTRERMRWLERTAPAQ